MYIYICITINIFNERIVTIVLMIQLIVKIISFLVCNGTVVLLSENMKFIEAGMGLAI